MRNRNNKQDLDKKMNKIETKINEDDKKLPDLVELLCEKKIRQFRKYFQTKCQKESSRREKRVRKESCRNSQNIQKRKLLEIESIIKQDWDKEINKIETKIDGQTRKRQSKENGDRRPQ